MGHKDQSLGHGVIDRIDVEIDRSWWLVLQQIFEELEGFQSFWRIQIT